MDEKVIIAALLGAAAGIWWAKRQQCKCQAQAQQQTAAADPLAWLGAWQA